MTHYGVLLKNKMKKKILITGVAGFIGSRIAQKFLDSGYTVYGVDDLSSGYKINIPKKVIFIKKDISKKSSIRYLPKNIIGILHLAGQSSGEKAFMNH